MRNKKTITFSDALKASNSSTAFSAMVKPVGSACNLRCTYCYYLDKEILHHRGVMSLEMLETFIKQYIEGNTVDEVSFCWHGGEPLLAGLPFYQRALELQAKYAGGKKIINTLQTNGTLITDEWAQFFAANDFLIGISIDGPQAVHQATRGNSFARAMRGVECLQRADAQFNTLSAVSSASAGRGVEIYRFLKSIGSRYIQFLPVQEFKDGDLIVQPGKGAVADYSISASDWGRFNIDVFEEWVTGDVGETFVQLFDATLANYCGVRAGICSLNESCGDALVVEYTGDTYSCDHFVYPEYRLGNIATDSLQKMFRSSRQFNFGAAKHTTLHEDCVRCEFLRLCHGECPKHRDESGLSSFCEGYKMFFRFTRPYFEFMRDALGQERPASTVISYARSRMGI
ncbi:MAG: anaerobic sulfatase maturase [Mucinivorans sp.]